MLNNFSMLPVGDRAVLVDLDGLDAALTLFQQLNTSMPNGVYDLVPAAKTILVRFDNNVLDVAAVKQWLETSYSTIESNLNTKQSSSASDSILVEIPVIYDGLDLHQVAEYLGISPAELIDRHTGTDFIGAFAGFAPGFVYLSKGDPIFTNIPRLNTPRTRVPASSIAVAGDFSAIYPKASPGGWQLLGTTPETMWDLQRPNPALIKPGYRVRFHAISNKNISLPVAHDKASLKTPDSEMQQVQHDTNDYVDVIAPGVQTLIQDFGRPGLTSMGVSTSGALDRLAMAAANELVGNPSDYPVLENAMGGLQLRFNCAALIAITGAETNVTLSTESGVRIPAGSNSKLMVAAGNILKIGHLRSGMRVYIAIRGGIAIEPVLGSLTTDILAGIGPDPLKKGMRLPINPTTTNDLSGKPGVLKDTNNSNTQAVVKRQLPKPGQIVDLNIIAGPRDDWFAKSALASLIGQTWQVTTQSNRVGLRLQAPESLQRINDMELPSEGTVAGAIQVPASGQPVLFLADHPLTGGYPVIAVLASDQINLAGQIPIGAKIRFKLINS